MRQPAEARAAFLEAACEGHPELRATLENLLRESDDADPFLRPGGALDSPLRDDLSAILSRHMAAASGSDRSRARVVMPRPHAPWWLFVVAASFLAYLALAIYSSYFGPEPLGVSINFGESGLLLRAVSAESPAARAGLKPGDRVVAVDGRERHNRLDWAIVKANLEVGRPNRWQIERDSDRREVILTLERRSRTWSQPSRILTTLAWGAKLITLILGLVIGFKRAHEPVGLVGALSLASVTSGDWGGVPPGMAAVWRDLPLPVGLLLWIPLMGAIVSGPLLFTFFSIFPRRLFHRRWLWLVIWAPAVVPLPWLVSICYRLVYRPGDATGALDWLLTTYIWTWVVYVLGGLTVLVVNYRRLETVNDRRRVRVVVAGSVVGLLASVPGTMAIYLVALPRLTSAVFSVPGVTLQVIAFLAFPLSIAYAILRHRLFDIRLIVRQGLQYAFARRLLLSVAPLLAATLVLDVLLHREDPTIETLQARGWMYAGVAVVALTAHARRRPWLEALDRRFFREPYNAQRLLREAVDEVRGTTRFEEVAPRAVARIEAALHPKFVAIFVREPRTSTYVIAAAAPSGQAPPPVPVGSKILGLVRLLGKPVKVGPDESGWLRQQLPDYELEFLRESHLELIVPIATQDERDALIVLGAKRSEEPYSREDQELLAAIATSLALLLEKPVHRPRQAASLASIFEECPNCGKCYDTHTGRCQEDGAALLQIALPRLVAGRYRLESRLGRGGMGTVYEASDTALERVVAVKVIREDLLASSEAAERFRREARATAGFAHPNVVTIHDFGFATEARAFLVMERLHGRTLREELRQGRLPADLTLEILRGVCAAVDAAHCRQLIHRDLKPENIFLCRDRSSVTAKVLDFGVAKFLSLAMQSTAETATGVLVGTMRYMAPEQLRGEPPKASWDIWALGTITYEMLTGTHPYADVNSLEWPAALIAGCWTPVWEHLVDVPVRWQQFFERAFAREIARRPASALVFLSELESALV